MTMQNGLNPLTPGAPGGMQEDETTLAQPETRTTRLTQQENRMSRMQAPAEQPGEALDTGTMNAPAWPEELKGKVEQARAAGYTDEQITAYLRSRGYEPQQTVPTAANNESALDRARKAGYSDEQIAQYQGPASNYDTIRESEFATPDEAFTWESDIPSVNGDFGPVRLSEYEVISTAQEIGVDPRTQAGINAVYNAKNIQNFQRNTQATVATLQELGRIDRPWMWMQSHFSNHASQEYDRLRDANVNRVLEMGRDRGIELIYEEGRFWAPGPNGELQHVTPNFLDSIGKAKYEITGGIVGGTAAVGILRQLGPYGQRAQVLAGMAGATIGAVAGNQVDYLTAAIEAQETWDAKIAAERALGSAQMSVIGEVAGISVWKLGSMSYRGIRQGYRELRNGNLDGAYEALKEGLGYISDDEIQEIVARWEALNQRTAPGNNAKEKALAIAPTTSAGGENIIQATAKVDPAASSAVSADINARAQDLLRASREVTPENAGAQLLTSLRDYERTVQTNFGVVRQQGIDQAPLVYRFDMESIGIRPLIESKMTNIDDPATLERLERVLTRIDNYTDSRTFEDLLDLRRTVNDFKYNKKINSQNDYKAINEALANIDHQIRSVADNMEDGAQWMRDWKDANKQYARYAQVRNNALWRALRRPGLDENEVARQLVRYGDAIDDTYNEIVSVIPPQIRVLVENSIVDQMINKYTAGNIGEFRAVQFPMLNDALRVYSFDTPDASRMQEVIRRMSEVYKNDVRLADASGRLSIPAFQSYLTTSPVARAQYEVASSMFNWIKRLVPGHKADTLALVNKVGKLLEDPLNTQAASQVLREVRDDQQLTAMITRMQAAVARDRAEGGVQTTWAKLYKDGSGRTWMQPGRGRSEAGESIPTHRVTTEEDAKGILDVNRINSSTLDRAARINLLDRGFVAVRLDDGQLIRLDTGVPQ